MVITNTGTGDLAPIVGITQKFLPAGTSNTWPWPTTTGGVLIPGPWSIIRADTFDEIATGTDAIPTCVTAPSAPGTLTAAPTNVSGQLRLSWLSPASDGGSAVTDYIVQRSPDGTTGWVPITDGVSTATSYTVTGLANGTRYYFRVLAVSNAGTSAPSNVADNIARTVATAPQTLTATPTSVSGQIRLGWVAPVSNGGSAVTDYIVQTVT
jgi:hypothetical protein